MLRLRKVLKAARRAGVRPAVILTSPLTRAVETAEAAASVLKCPKVVPDDVLLPGRPPSAAWNRILEHKRCNAVLLSGHEPMLSRTLCFLIGAPEGAVAMKKAALARVDVAPGPRPKGVLLWLLTPKLASPTRPTASARSGSHGS
jgi:phosphohistidine phosphatase